MLSYPDDNLLDGMKKVFNGPTCGQKEGTLQHLQHQNSQ